jgi:hypothetical protein
MIAVDIQLKGLENVIKKWGNASGIVRQRSIAGMNRVLTTLLEDVTIYPPPREGQKYVRTYRLGHNWGWEIVDHGNEVKGILFNRDTPYAKWVQDRVYQNRRYHAGRWTTIQDIAKSRRGFILGTMSQEYGSPIRGIFGGIEAKHI